MTERYQKEELSMHKKRTLNDAELLKEGAVYVADKESTRLEVTREQFQRTLKEFGGGIESKELTEHQKELLEKIVPQASFVMHDNMEFRGSGRTIRNLQSTFNQDFKNRFLKWQEMVDKDISEAIQISPLVKYKKRDVVHEKMVEKKGLFGTKQVSEKFIVREDDLNTGQKMTMREVGGNSQSSESAWVIAYDFAISRTSPQGDQNKAFYNSPGHRQSRLLMNVDIILPESVVALLNTEIKSNPTIVREIIKQLLEKIDFSSNEEVIGKDKEEKVADFLKWYNYWLENKGNTSKLYLHEKEKQFNEENVIEV